MYVFLKKKLKINNPGALIKWWKGGNWNVELENATYKFIYAVKKIGKQTTEDSHTGVWNCKYTYIKGNAKNTALKYRISKF